jgi:hypothetical protein
VTADSIDNSPKPFLIANCSIPPGVNFPDGVGSWRATVNIADKQLHVVPSGVVNNTVITEAGKRRQPKQSRHLPRSALKTSYTFPTSLFFQPLIPRSTHLDRQQGWARSSASNLPFIPIWNVTPL